MTTTPQIFHALTYADAERGLAFLTGIGFTEALVVRGSDDPSRIEHAELRWRDNGGVMLGSVPDDGSAGAQATGHAKCYLVLPTDDDVDATYARAISAGGAAVDPPADQPYGGRGATVADPEGNHWSLGSYAGA